MNLEAWTDVADDPDPCSDLGYEIEELQVIESEASSQVIFLPEDEEYLDQAEFIIIDADSLIDLGSN